MLRLFRLAYGLAAYAVFLVTFLYAIGFTSNLVVPKSIDTGVAEPVWLAVLVDLCLLSIFALQHSVMARKSFKVWLHQFMPAAIERSTYVLAASLALVLLFWQWRPIPALVWDVHTPWTVWLVTAMTFVGWLLVLFSTFLINHFELFGVQQVIADAAGSTASKPIFRTPLLYKVVRHPIYLGFMIAFWVSPTMSLGHMLFAGVTTAYIFIGIALEERDLVSLFGEQYLAYKARVAMVVPGLTMRRTAVRRYALDDAAVNGRIIPTSGR